MHAHDIALSISRNGTSRRRYKAVRLIEVQERLETWVLSENNKTTASNPLLPNFDAMSHTGPFDAGLGRTHFVEGQKLVKEGRRYMDQVNGERLQLNSHDIEGQLIQEKGVQAIVYSARLWEDKTALLALMQEDNMYGKRIHRRFKATLARVAGLARAAGWNDDEWDWHGWHDWTESSSEPPPIPWPTVGARTPATSAASTQPDNFC